MSKAKEFDMLNKQMRVKLNETDHAEYDYSGEVYITTNFLKPNEALKLANWVHYIMQEPQAPFELNGVANAIALIESLPVRSREIDGALSELRLFCDYVYDLIAREKDNQPGIAWHEFKANRKELT